MTPPRPWLLPAPPETPNTGTWKAENNGSAEMAGAVEYVPAAITGARLHEVARIVWMAMVWAAQQPPPPHGAAHPDYYDWGNSDAELQARMAAMRILMPSKETPHDYDHFA